MPPPSFSSAGAVAPSIPRALQTSVRDASQSIADALREPSELEPALVRARALVADPALGLPDTRLYEAAQLATPDARTAALRAAVADKVHAELVQVVRAAAVPPSADATLVTLLEVLAPLLGADLVNAWWDHIYPQLCAGLVAAHRLAVFVLLSVPPTQYPPLDASWVTDEGAEAPRGALFARAQAAFAASDAPGVSSALIAFGALQPARFYYHVAGELGSGAPPLRLLVVFMQQHSLHIYRTTTTPLPAELVALMQRTDDAHVQALAVTVLAMILPHTPLWVIHGGAGGLPALFHVYARTLSRWPASVPGAEPHARMLFTLLYGLFPCNTLLFLRGPTRYLAERAYAGPPGWEDDIECGRVLAESEAFLRTHAVHPLLLEFDETSEMLETRRWLHHDASDLMAMCSSLCLVRAADAPDAAPLLESHLALRTAELDESDAQTEIARLRTALHFELYLKDQHLQHIGRLHRDRISAAVDEAEHQNLYATVRTLGMRLQSAQTTHERQRAELQATSQRHQQWERELNTKLNTYRDERRRWTHESAQLHRELALARETNALLARRTAMLGARLFELETDLAVLRPKLDQLDVYGSRVQQLSNCLANWEGDLARYDDQRSEMHKLLSRWHEMELLLQNSEDSARCAREAAAREAQRAARLERQLDALAAQHAKCADTAARRWEAQAVHAAPPRAAPPPHLAKRNTELELEVLQLRARIEELAMESRTASAAAEQAASHAAGPAAAPENHALYSPSLLMTPAALPQVDDDAMPPLRLDPAVTQ